MSVFALLERLAPHVEKEVNLVLNSKQEADTLSFKLKKIQIGLEVAEREGATNASVRDWLKQLEDVAYEMDDVLDEWEMVNLRVELGGSEDDMSGPWEKVRSFLDCLYRCFTHVLDRREITKKMIALSDTLDSILTEKDKYNFGQTKSNHFEEFKQQETTSDITALKVYGRDSDAENLVEKLLSDGEGEGGTQIVSVVGIGGVGKTTLAQLVYDSPQVQSNFGLRGWVSVPKPFDTLVVARRILEAFRMTSQNIQSLESLEALVNEIKTIVKKNKFLLVLDNVWTEDHSRWVPLKRSLNGVRGSRILVTTRSELVARMMGTTQWQPLGLLSDQDCEAILDGIALSGRSREEREILKVIGMEMAKKCNGLPLVAMNVGSMLALRFTEQEWRYVLDNPLWKHEDEIGDLYRLLKLSYVDLSSVLKRCFLCCIVFPKGSLIYLDELFRIWMAYGYLSSYDKKDELESKGLKYFQMLAMRSFLQKLEGDEDDEGRIQFKIHDVMYDFAIYLSNDGYSLIMDGGVERGKSSPSFGKIRTFCASEVSQRELPLDHLEMVRVLKMNHCNLQELPKEVGKLIHLRYLDLSCNSLRELPEIVSDLYNLQTLALENCDKLCKLPEGIGKLINLRHLLNSGTKELKQYPQGLKKLIGLWTLSEFRATSPNELEVLENMNELQGSLCIFLPILNGIADNLEKVGKANLKNKIYLHKLALFFQVEEQTDNVVYALQPPPNLQRLAIHGISCSWFSHWIDNASFNNLKVVEFDGCGKCSNLPPFGKLPALEKLTISHCDFECLNLEFLGVHDGLDDAMGILEAKEGSWFPKLMTLHFDSCFSWREWADIRKGGHEHSIPIMPHLKGLSMAFCVSLIVLPHNLLRHVNSLQYFYIYSCPFLKVIYDKDKRDWDHISHIPHVEFMSYKELLGLEESLGVFAALLFVVQMLPRLGFSNLDASDSN